ncbi:protein I'm not dead yet-like [Teleopsis dalmanni]|uniref:protein I'm not dead yet-like n=1 Tax=Teleopsis dalmanni TaxID=139649 RepID=UPI0018CD8D8A|nr:protein I'm not dead yet-like [Teleopsis dalmanni]
MDENERIGIGTACGSCCGNHWKGIFTVLIPLIVLPLPVLLRSDEFICLYVVIVMAFYWVTEVAPLYITSLLPVFVFPILGILDSNTVCKQYFKDPLVMFLGGLMIALSIEYCNLHKRIALITIKAIGCSPRRLHFGLVAVSSFISMWISNAATTAMMCPVIRAVLDELKGQNIIEIYNSADNEKQMDERDKSPSPIALGYYLSSAYATTVGGCGTLIGTGTNLTFKGIYDTRFPEATDEISFPGFIAYALPFVIIMTGLLYFSMQISHFGMFRPNSEIGKQVTYATENAGVVKKVIDQRYEELGPMSCHEKQVVILFILMVVLLFTRKPGFVTGWAEVVTDKAVNSSAPMVFVLFWLFIFPINCACLKFCKSKAKGRPKSQLPALISWFFLNKETPWGLVFLLGGGFALAEGSTQSGMAKMLGNSLKFAQSFPSSIVQLFCVVTGVFFTAFSANVAIANILIPVVSEMAVAIKIHPLYFVFPTGLACSIAFLLPVSTPANAIVSGYANIKTKDMVIAGLLPTFFSILLLSINGLTWHSIIYPGLELPSWAK